LAAPAVVQGEQEVLVEQYKPVPVAGKPAPVVKRAGVQVACATDLAAQARSAAVLEVAVQVGQAKVPGSVELWCPAAVARVEIQTAVDLQWHEVVDKYKAYAHNTYTTEVVWKNPYLGNNMEPGDTWDTGLPASTHDRSASVNLENTYTCLRHNDRKGVEAALSVTGNGTG
jgi:hypothetical protein